jgi:predicted Zn finger-like uncharacterized protein
MSLATRCTACGTVFRVVQDQLKISEGWVRCGRCKEVFNALEGLFDLDREAPPPWQPPPPTPVPGSAVDVSLPVDDAQAGAVPAAAAMTPVDESSDAADASQRTALEATPPTSDVAVEPPAPAAAPEPIVERPEPQHTVDDAVSRFGPVHEPIEEPPPSGAPTAVDSAVDIMLDESTVAAANSAPADAPPASPAFLRDAERRARWQSPRARAGFGLAVLALGAVLALQATYHLRDPIVAHWPSTRPLLEAMCDQLDCSLGPLQRIDDIAVESSSLTRAAEPGVDALRLTIVLRNRGALPLAMPMVDLSLTDGNGELVARRALAASDFDRASATLAPASEASLHLAFSTDGRRVAGYTVEIFYP